MSQIYSTYLHQVSVNVLDDISHGLAVGKPYRYGHIINLGKDFFFEVFLL